MSEPSECVDAQTSDTTRGCPPVEIVVSGTRTPESAQRAVVRTDMISREEAERRGARTVADALSGEPTLQVNPEAYGYLGRPSGVQIQGMDADRVLVLEDGERVIGDVGGVVDLAQLSLTDVDRIEYVAGPMSSLYGTNALGGVINVISAPPAAEGLSFRFREEARSRGELLAQLSAAARQDESWAAVDTFLDVRRGLRGDDNLQDLVVPDTRSHGVGLRSGFSLSRTMALRLKARWSQHRSDGFQTELIQDAQGFRSYPIDLPERTDRFGLHVAESIDVTDRIRLALSLRRSWFFTKSRKDRRRSPIDEQRERRLSNQSFESVLTITDGESRTWVFGVRAEGEHFEQTLARTLNRASGVASERVREVEPTLIATGAAYGQVGWKVNDLATLLPGIRVEMNNRYGTVATPRLAAAVALSERLNVRASAGRGFRAPTAREFGFQFDHSDFGYRVLGNRDLVAESSWGTTADVTYRDDRLRVRAGAFANWIRDLITIELAPEQPVGGVTDFVYQNVARARTAGGDASVHARVSDWLSASAAYAYLWTRDDSNGEPLPNRPDHTVTLRAHADVERVHTTLSYRVVSSAHLQLDEQETRTPAFGMLDARVELELWASLHAYAGGFNLLDARRDFDELSDTRPAIGRTFYVGFGGEVPAED